MNQAVKLLYYSLLLDILCVTYFLASTMPDPQDQRSLTVWPDPQTSDMCQINQSVFFSASCNRILYV